MTNLSNLSFKESAVEWWEDLGDLKQEELLLELYCKENNILVE